MQNRDTNSINMLRATITWCNNNSAATAAIPAFAAAKTTVENKLTLIDEYTQTALRATKGTTTDTKNIRAAMQNIAHKCASALSAYAATQKNNTLRAKVNYSLNAMSAKKKEEIDDICQTIHDEANSNIASATPFGYNASDVSDLSAAIALYRQKMQDPRQAIISRATALLSLRTQLREIKTIHLKQIIDSMVSTLRLTNPTFVSGYFQARQIIDLGSTSAKLRGIITSADGSYLTGATISIRKTATTQILHETKTGSDGKFGIYNITPGDYDFLYTHTTHQPKTETNIHISAGKEIKRRITLVGQDL